MDRLRTLHESGTSISLDTLSRDLLDSGALDEHITHRSVTGVTCNPSIFAAALRRSARYDADIRRMTAQHTTGARQLYFVLALTDTRRAARKLRPVYAASGGRDGYVSFECTPDVADDPSATIAQAERVRLLVPEPNLTIKVPATDAGFAAIEELTARGVNVNVTLLFTESRWEQAARAYHRGLRRRYDAGHRVDNVRSVASVFVSRIDARVEGEAAIAPHPSSSAGVALARHLRRRLVDVFSGPDWLQLRDAGAHPQRLLWASTTPKSASRPDVFYVEQLALQDTIVTVSEAILAAFADHGRPQVAAAATSLQSLRPAGIDLERVGSALLDEGLDAFSRDYAEALAILRRRATGVSTPHPSLESAA